MGELHTSQRRSSGASAWTRRIAWVALVLGTSLAPAGAPATVQEQRARLPPPAHCPDSVTGTWRAHKYNERHYEWMLRTLEIRRVEGQENEIEGTIEAHYWKGSPEQSQPPGTCVGDLQHVIVSMDAKGTVNEAGQIVFSGHGQWRLDAHYCGQMGGYNLDSFSGVIDHELEEFQSVNNDGGRAVDEPEVFRRIACLPGQAIEEDAPRVSVTPPPFYPAEESPRSASGCLAAGARF